MTCPFLVKSRRERPTGQTLYPTAPQTPRTWARLKLVSWNSPPPPPKLAAGGGKTLGRKDSEEMRGAAWANGKIKGLLLINVLGKPPLGKLWAFLPWLMGGWGSRGRKERKNLTWQKRLSLPVLFSSILSTKAGPLITLPASFLGLTWIQSFVHNTLSPPYPYRHWQYFLPPLCLSRSHESF